MGVVEGLEKSNPPLLIEEVLSDPESLPPVVSPPPKSPKKLKNRSPKPMDSTKATGRKAKGCKHSRRMENLHYLMTLVENEEFGELEISDFVEPTVSAFAELLNEHEKMKVWNDFVNRTEEEQQRFLQDSTQKEVHSERAETEDMEKSGWEVVEDKRAIHPTYTAQECFRRIDRGLRKLLKKRHVPKGTLESLEKELTSFFRDSPESVFVSHVPNSFERCLLHAICQYLDLHSKSFDKGGTRQTQIENKQVTFSPPATPLTKYLEGSS